MSNKDTPGGVTVRNNTVTHDAHRDGDSPLSASGNPASGKNTC